MRESTILQIDVDEELVKIIQRVNNLRDQLSAPRTLANSLNAAGRKVRKQIVADTKEQYAISNKKMLKDKSQGAPQLFTATAANLTASIMSKGSMQDIMSFMTQPNSETGAAAAKVLNSGSMKSLEIRGLKAFVATFRSGHTAIVQRRGAARLPVKKLLSPAVPHLLANEKVREKAEEMTYEILQEEIRKRIAKIVGA